MRRFLPLLLVLLVLLTLSCRRPKGVNAPVDVLDLVVSTSSDADEIVMHEADEDARAGDVYTDTDTTLAEQLGTFRSADGQAKLLMEERDRRVVRTEVLGVRGGGVVRWRLTFLELAVARQANQNPVKLKPLPQVNKPYVIDVSTEPTAVTDSQGAPVSEVERAAVLREVTIAYKQRTFHDPDAAPSAPVAAVRDPTHTVRAGQPMPWLKDYLERRLSYDTSESHTEAKIMQTDLIEVREVDGKPCALTAVWIQVVTTGTDERRIGTEVRGQALVRAEDGEILALAFKGSTQVHLNLEIEGDKPVTVDAMGKLRAQTQRTWEKRGGR